MTTTVMTSKGQVVIPSEFRKKLNLKRGTPFYVEERGGKLILNPVTDEYFEKSAGMLDTKGKLAKELLRERARDKKREAER